MMSYSLGQVFPHYKRGANNSNSVTPLAKLNCVCGNASTNAKLFVDKGFLHDFHTNEQWYLWCLLDAV